MRNQTRTVRKQIATLFLLNQVIDMSSVLQPGLPVGDVARERQDVLTFRDAGFLQVIGNSIYPVTEICPAIWRVLKRWMGSICAPHIVATRIARWEVNPWFLPMVGQFEFECVAQVENLSQYSSSRQIAFDDKWAQPIRGKLFRNSSKCQSNLRYVWTV